MHSIEKDKPKILSDFCQYLISTQNYSLGTIENYYYSLIYFFRFIKEYREIDISINDFSIFNILTIDEKDIIAFMLFLNGYRNNVAETRNARLAAIKSFFQYVYSSSKYSLYCKDRINPTKNIDYSKKAYKLPKCLSLDEAKIICNIYNSDNSKYYIRNNTIIYLFLNTGLRKSELIDLTINNIDFDNRYIKIMGKGNKERIVHITIKTKEMLQEYLNTRGNISANSEEPLFISSRNKKISKELVSQIINRAYKIANIDKKGYTVHSLRHTAATLMYKGTNGDILAIKQILGHSSIESTQLYTHVVSEEVKKAISSNPLANFGVE